MPEIIHSRHGDREFASYDLLDQVRQHIPNRADAHTAIHAHLADLIDLDGEDTVILDRKPTRPDLLAHNPRDEDVDSWITITDDAAQAIRDAIAAQHALD